MQLFYVKLRGGVMHMEKIESFKTDHTLLEPGLYVSRRDGDIVTYDLRMKKPNTGDLLSNGEIHSFEHMLATYLRNGSIADKVIYVGPMGCQTGFYVLVRMNDNEEFLRCLSAALEKIIEHDGEVFGKSAVECGNYANLDISLAKKTAAEFLDILKKTDVTFRYKG